MKIIPMLYVFCFGYIPFSPAQEGQFRTIAFYNVENLFDTQNDTLVFDDDRTPAGRYRWTLERYQNKIAALAYVLIRIGRSMRNGPPDVIGLCEVENASVLTDLIQHQEFKKFEYAIIHQDSPDERGMDVAFLYRPAAFTPIAFRTHRLELEDDQGRNDRTRDQLVVSGWMDHLYTAFIINHWPSRRGGQSRSAPHRMKAAQLNRKIIDSLRNESPEISIVTMGDFNDNPTDRSLRHLVIGNREEAIRLFNPMLALYRKGYGTLAYRDAWSLFDQIILDTKFLDSSLSPWLFQNVGIYNPHYLVRSDGRYRGYPRSTYSGGNYKGGVSDHFPVYIYLKRSGD